MSTATTRVTKRRLTASAVALSLLALPSMTMVAHAATVSDRTAVDQSEDQVPSTTRTIAFNTVVIEDPDLPADTEVVENPGSEGLKYVYTVSAYSEGTVPTYRDVVVREAQDRVIRKGTGLELPTAEAAPEPEPETVASRSASRDADTDSSTSASTSEETTYSEAATSAQYSLSDFMFSGVVNWNGYKFTYYSQSVLPGSGLSIPGRHVNAGGYVADIDGYIVLAAPYGVAHGTVFSTPFGYSGKVYDTCASCTTSPLWLDVYTQ